MVNHAFPFVAPLICLVFASGCSTPVDHPSLAPRAIEQFTVVEPEPAATPAPAPPLPADASRQERAAALTAQARDADILFRQHLAQTEESVAKGASAAPGSEAWVAAQKAVSSLETLHEQVSRSLADLDAIQIAAVEEGIGSGAESAVSGAIQELEAMEAAQRASIDALRARLASPESGT
jgi:hypothetical protein